MSRTTTILPLAIRPRHPFMTELQHLHASKAFRTRKYRRVRAARRADAIVRDKWRDCLKEWIAKGELQEGLSTRDCITKGKKEEEEEKVAKHKHRGAWGKRKRCLLRDVLGREGGGKVKSLKEELEEVGEVLGEEVDEEWASEVQEWASEVQEWASEVHGCGACACATEEEGEDRWSTAACGAESEREGGSGTEWEEEEKKEEQGCVACGPGSGCEIERWE